LTSIQPPLRGILAATRQSFLPFPDIPCKREGTTSMIRNSMPSGYDPMGGNRFSEKITLKPTDEIMIATAIMIWSQL
jgi:hypothetical protein